MSASVVLYIMLFGSVSMTAGPFATLTECQTVLERRSAELDVSFAKLPRGTGLSMGPRTAFRRDVTMECRFSDQPVPKRSDA